MRHATHAQAHVHYKFIYSQAGRRMLNICDMYLVNRIRKQHCFVKIFTHQNGVFTLLCMFMD